jgi:hypothetical protein
MRLLFVGSGRLELNYGDARNQVRPYRKFGVSSRAEAIERAVELGLLEDSLYPARAKTALSG